MSAKKLFRRILFIVGGGILVVIVLVIAAKLWIIPTSIEALIKNKLKSPWGGPVTVGEVEFDYKGSLHMDQLLLEDKSGKQFILLNDIHVLLGSWDGDLDIKSINVEALKVQMLSDFRKKSFRQGGKASVLENLKDGKLSINEIIVKDITVGLLSSDEQIPGLQYGNLSFNASMNDDGIVFNLKQAQMQGGGDHFELAGKIDSALSDLRLILNGHHDFSYEEVRFLMQLYGVESLYMCKGGVAGKIEVSKDLRGTGKNVANRANHDIAGDVNGYRVSADLNCTNTNVIRADAILLEDASFRIEMDGAKCTASNIVGGFCGGSMSGNLVVNNIGKDEVGFIGDVALKQVQLATLSEIFQTEKRFTKGEVFSKYHFESKGSGFKDMYGNGVVFVKGTDVYAIPSVTQVFDFIRIGQHTSANLTDLIAVFKNAGTAFELENAMIANELSAIKVESGAKLDFSNKTIDAYVIVVPFKAIGNIFEGIPIVNLLTGISDKMTRLRLKGKWTDPPNKLISKEPLGDVTEGTLFFLRDVLDNGGSIRKENFDSLIGSVTEK